MPFLTEELWHRLPQRAPEAGKQLRSIAYERFPDPLATWRDAEAEQKVAQLQELIAAARNIRAESKLDPKRRVPAEFFSADTAIYQLVEQNRDMVQRLATLSELRFATKRLDPTAGTVRATPQFELSIAQGDVVDVHAELARLRKEKERLEGDIESKTSKLADETFRSKAPAKIVSQMEATLAERRGEFEKLTERLTQLEKKAATFPTEAVS